MDSPCALLCSLLQCRTNKGLGSAVEIRVWRCLIQQKVDCVPCTWHFQGDLNDANGQSVQSEVLCFFQDAHALSLYLQPPLHEEPDRPNIGSMLDGEQAGCQRFGRIVITHLDHAL